MSDQSRRKLLKSIAAGSGAIVAGKSLPESWSRPVVDSVMLPVHAQTSCSPTVVQIPANVEVNINVPSGVGRNVWLCTPGDYTNGSGIDLVFYMESGTTLSVNSGLDDVFYLKSGVELTITSGFNFTVYYENGAVINDNSQGGHNLIETCELIFDTSVAPSCS